MRFDSDPLVAAGMYLKGWSVCWQARSLWPASESHTARLLSYSARQNARAPSRHLQVALAAAWPIPLGIELCIRVLREQHV